MMSGMTMQAAVRACRAPEKAPKNMSGEWSSDFTVLDMALGPFLELF